MRGSRSPWTICRAVGGRSGNEVMIQGLRCPTVRPRATVPTQGNGHRLAQRDQAITSDGWGRGGRPPSVLHLYSQFAPTMPKRADDCRPRSGITPAKSRYPPTALDCSGSLDGIAGIVLDAATRQSPAAPAANGPYLVVSSGIGLPGCHSHLGDERRRTAPPGSGGLVPPSRARNSLTLAETPVVIDSMRSRP